MPPLVMDFEYASRTVEVRIRPFQSGQISFLRKLMKYFLLFVSSLLMTEELKEDTARKRQQSIRIYYSIRTTEISETLKYTFRRLDL